MENKMAANDEPILLRSEPRSLQDLAKRVKREKERYLAWHEDVNSRDLQPDPTWQTLDGVAIYRIENDPIAGVPCSGRKNSKKYQMFNVETREPLCQLDRREVSQWLKRMRRPSFAK